MNANTPAMERVPIVLERNIALDHTREQGPKRNAVDGAGGPTHHPDPDRHNHVAVLPKNVGTIPMLSTTTGATSDSARLTALSTSSQRAANAGAPTALRLGTATTAVVAIGSGNAHAHTINEVAPQALGRTMGTGPAHLMS